MTITAAVVITRVEKLQMAVIPDQTYSQINYLLTY